VGGLRGWEADVRADRVRLAPHLPPTWDSVTVERLPAGSGRYTARLVRTRDSFRAAIERTSGRGVDTVEFSPSLPLGVTLRGVTVNGQPAACGVRTPGPDVHVDCTVPLGERTEIVVRHTAGRDVLLEAPRPQRRERSRALKPRAHPLASATLGLARRGCAVTGYCV